MLLLVRRFPLPLLSRGAGLAPLFARPRAGTVLAALGLAVVLAGCTTQRVAPPAPVEDRGVGRPAPAAPAPSSVTPSPAPAPVAAAPAAAPLPPGAENAGKPGYYTVRPGDSLIRIGLETGQNWRDLARWNQLENPNRLEVGQVLRVVPPVPGAPVVAVPVAPSAPSFPSGASAAGVSTSAVAGASVVAQPLPAVGSPAPAGSTAGAVNPPAASATPAAPVPMPKSDPDDLTFIWPAPGAVIAGFDDQKNKGLGIAGKAGEPVLAAADGKVVYAGSGLRGYGNLVILKHNNTFLTAYAHNQTLLVKEDQTVRQGQRIAEMGSSDTDRVKLHFEIRRNGKPVDPAKLLPAR